MELSEYLGLFAGDCCLADGLSELVFSEDVDVDGIEYPGDEERDQREHDDIIEFDQHESAERHKTIRSGGKCIQIRGPFQA